jgi:hypothetical protein
LPRIPTTVLLRGETGTGVLAHRLRAESAKQAILVGIILFSRHPF